MYKIKLAICKSALFQVKLQKYKFQVLSISITDRHLLFTNSFTFIPIYFFTKIPPNRK